VLRRVANVPKKAKIISSIKSLKQEEPHCIDNSSPSPHVVACTRKKRQL
jgi:hypothetical protein